MYQNGPECRRRFLGDFLARTAPRSIGHAPPDSSARHDSARSRDMSLTVAAQPPRIGAGHPERFDELARLLRDRGERFVRRTSGVDVTADTAVYLCDTMGEVMSFYAACDVAFVAGSLVPIGGHNLLEPAILGRPVLTGPYNFNSEDIARRLSDARACVIVESGDELATTVANLLERPTERAELGSRAQAVLNQNRGALRELLMLLAPLITRPIAPQAT